MSVKLIIDSASDITNEEADKLGITVVPLTITFGDVDFQDGVNLSKTEFYEKLATCTTLPKTSQINEYTWSEVFDRELKNTDELIVITISSKLSGTYESAMHATENFNGKVHVIDSMTACAGEKILGLYAQELINQGKSAQEIINDLENIKNKVHVLAMVDTLKYLKMGGRISSTVALAGTILNIKPIAKIVDGEVKVIGKVIGFKKAEAFITKTILDAGGIDLSKPYCGIYSGTKDDKLDLFLNSNKETLSIDSNTNKYCIGGTIGTHVGPGAFGFAFFAK